MPREPSRGRRAKQGRDDEGADDTTGDEKLDIAGAPDPAKATPAQVRKYNQRSVERVISILNVLQESPETMSLVEISRAVDLAKASTFRYLWTLEKNRYVERDQNSGQYRLGVGFVGMQSRNVEVLRSRAKPWLEKLRDEIEETANLGVLEGYTVIYLDAAESRRGVRMARSRGSRDALHCTALGKAIAARLPEGQVREILDHVEMTANTAKTITKVDDYLAELAKVRERGYAIDDGENEVDGRCVAVAIPDENLHAALSISGPASRFSLDDAKKVAKRLTEVANRLASAPKA